MRNLRLTIQYIGTRYRGWQSQRGGGTIQDSIEAALGAVLGEKIRITGAGRTDAGVHAREQVANFQTGTRREPGLIRRGANALLPADIRILRVSEAEIGFHACRDAREKHYAYRFAVGEVVSPFEEPFVYSVRGSVDLPAMEKATRKFLGSHDFTSFCASGCRARDRVRHVKVSRVESENGGGIVIFRVSANGFLQHMVRNLAGTLIQVGRGRLDPERIPEILEARDRCLAGPCAPAKGLTLEGIDYGAGG